MKSARWAQFKHNWGQSRQTKTILVHSSWYHRGEEFGETSLPVCTQKPHSSIHVKISIGLAHKEPQGLPIGLGHTHLAFFKCTSDSPILIKHSQIPGIDHYAVTVLFQFLALQCLSSNFSFSSCLWSQEPSRCWISVLFQSETLLSQEKLVNGLDW